MSGIVFNLEKTLVCISDEYVLCDKLFLMELEINKKSKWIYMRPHLVNVLKSVGKTHSVYIVASCNSETAKTICNKIKSLDDEIKFEDVCGHDKFIHNIRHLDEYSWNKKWTIVDYSLKEWDTRYYEYMLIISEFDMFNQYRTNDFALVEILDIIGIFDLIDEDLEKYACVIQD